MFGEVPNLCPRLHLPLKPDRIACWPHEPQVRHGPLHDACGRPPRRPSRHCPVHRPHRRFSRRNGRAISRNAGRRTCGQLHVELLLLLFRPPRNRRQPPHRQGRTRRKAASPRTVWQALQEALSSDWLKARVGCKTDILLEGASRKQDGEDAATESWQGRDPWGDAVNVSLPAGIGKPGLIVPVTIVTAKKHSLIGELRG